MADIETEIICILVYNQVNCSLNYRRNIKMSFKL